MTFAKCWSAALPCPIPLSLIVFLVFILLFHGFSFLIFHEPFLESISVIFFPFPFFFLPILLSLSISRPFFHSFLCLIFSASLFESKWAVFPFYSTLVEILTQLFVASWTKPVTVWRCLLSGSAALPLPGIPAVVRRVFLPFWSILPALLFACCSPCAYSVWFGLNNPLSLYCKRTTRIKWQTCFCIFMQLMYLSDICCKYRSYMMIPPCTGKEWSLLKWRKSHHSSLSALL